MYTNGDAAELFLNGKSLGEKPVADRLQPVLHWEVPNEPGVVRVIGKRAGSEAARFELATAGAPDHLELLPDRPTRTISSTHMDVGISSSAASSRVAWRARWYSSHSMGQ